MITLEDALRYTPGKDLMRGHIFLLDKPLGWTSFNVVGKVKHLLRQHLGLRAIKVGHAGTLDPLATGLMVVCVGGATRLAMQLTSDDKWYEAEFTLGATTPSFDLETPVEGGFPTSHITPALLHEAVRGLTGNILQRPPLFSAKRVDGHRAYATARRGGELALEPVPVAIHDFTVRSFANNRVEATIHCSKGTYIRALARDLGEGLQSAAYLSSLRRTRSGGFSVEDAVTIPDFESFVRGIAPLYARPPADAHPAEPSAVSPVG